MPKLMHPLPFLLTKLFSACPEYLLRYLHLPVSVYIPLCSFSLVHRLIGIGNHVKEVNHYPGQGDGAPAAFHCLRWQSSFNRNLKTSFSCG